MNIRADMKRVHFAFVNRIKENVFQYAGTKDRRARTSQEVTANRYCLSMDENVTGLKKNIFLAL